MTRVEGIKQGVSPPALKDVKRGGRSKHRAKTGDQPTGPHTWGAYEQGLGQELSLIHI